MSEVCPECDRLFRGSCPKCKGSGVERLSSGSSYKWACDCCECKHAKTLYDDEGLLVLDPKGDLYTNQTAGVLCHHPKARGRFMPMPVPRFVQDRLFDQCFPDEGDLAHINRKFDEAGLPFRATGGEEAWLFVETPYGDGILVWGNSD